MAGITHDKVLTGSDGTNPNRAQPSDWNADHVLPDPLDLTGDLNVDTIDESTTDAGVTIDGTLIKDDTITGSTANHTTLKSGSGKNVYLTAQGSYAVIDASTGILMSVGTWPDTDSAYALGKAGNFWSNVYTDAINFGDEDLDTYDEGEWSPSLSFATPGDQSIAYSTQLGYYTRIGNLVHVVGRLQTSTFTHSTASGNLQITGLPFTVSSTGAVLKFTGTAAMQTFTLSNSGMLTFSLTGGQTYGTLTSTRSAAGITTLTTAHVATGATVLLYVDAIFYV